MEGVWKVSFAARRSASKLVPRHLRFRSLDSTRLGLVEVPHVTGHGGRWALTAGPADAAGAQSARFIVECDGAALLFDGLFDGERVAGSVWQRHLADVAAESEPLPEPWLLTGDMKGAEPEDKIGEFLCTRLFTFWGPPSPSAAT